MNFKDFSRNYKILLSLPFQLGWQGNYIFLATSGMGLSILMMKKKYPGVNFLHQELEKSIFRIGWQLLLCLFISIL